MAVVELGEEGPAEESADGSSPDDDISEDGPLHPTPATHHHRLTDVQLSLANKSTILCGRLTVGRRRLLRLRGLVGGCGRRPQHERRGCHALEECVQLTQRERVVQRLQRTDRRHAAEPLERRYAHAKLVPSGRGKRGSREGTLTVRRGGGRDHDAQVRRRARARDDGGAEEASSGELAARAQPEHLEVGHLAGDAVPLPAPCGPALATLPDSRAVVPRPPRAERERRQGQLVRRRLHALDVDERRQRRGRAAGAGGRPLGGRGPCCGEPGAGRDGTESVSMRARGQVTERK